MRKNAFKLVDTYGRRLNYLRISVTDRCNLRCLYCGPPRPVQKLRQSEILTYEELERLAGIAVDLGVKKVRVTGGEPLVRKGIFGFLSRLSALEGLEEVTLTTNGVKLAGNIRRIRESGIRRINVSLDTLQPERYPKVTGYDHFQAVWSGIEEAKRRGFNPIKVNVVVLRGFNDDEVLDFAALSLEEPYHIRFIEYMPFGAKAGGTPLEYVPSLEIRERIERMGKLTEVPAEAADGPARRFKLEGAAGEIGFISPISDHFCEKCNRLRLTASGLLRPCLLSGWEFDLKDLLRSGGSDDELAEVFLEVTRRKLKQHHLSTPGKHVLADGMTAIGG
jgi:cyclic pyranopterin phosphate synthase